MSNWISVEDKLPQDNKYVLVFTPALGNTEMATYDGVRWLPDYILSHWQPLPEPPIENKELDK